MQELQEHVNRVHDVRLTEIRLQELRRPPFLGFSTWFVTKQNWNSVYKTSETSSIRSSGELATKNFGKVLGFSTWFVIKQNSAELARKKDRTLAKSQTGVIQPSITLLARSALSAYTAHFARAESQTGVICPSLSLLAHP